MGPDVVGELAEFSALQAYGAVRARELRVLDEEGVVRHVAAHRSSRRSR